MKIHVCCYLEMMQYLLLSHVGRLIEKKQEHLLVAVQRYFVVRHFTLHMLKEMRLSNLKELSQTDFRAVLMEDPSENQPSVSSTLKVGKDGFFLSISILSFKDTTMVTRCSMSHIPLSNIVAKFTAK